MPLIPPKHKTETIAVDIASVSADSKASSSTEESVEPALRLPASTEQNSSNGAARGSHSAESNHAATPAAGFSEQSESLPHGTAWDDGPEVSAANSVQVQKRMAAEAAALYRPIQNELLRVEDRIHLELQSPYESLAEVLRHGTQLGGKRLRPAMLLLAGSACGTLTDAHVTMGTVIEMVHTATLIHDDVLDDAATRRHVATINAKWDNHTSILLGDYLFAQSFRLAATLPSTEACRWVGEAARLVCEGELRQVLGRHWVDLDETTYLQMIRGKTAELTRVATQLGARLSGADEATVDAMADYGLALGTAFQIADDFLDLWGHDAAVGKTLGTDLEQGKMTLPIIRLLETVSPAEANRLRKLITEDRPHRMVEIMDALAKSDAADYTRRRASQFRDEAVRALEGLAPSASKDSLRQIADFAIDRRF